MNNYLEHASDSYVDLIVWFVISVIIVWLFWSAAIMGIETSDGYSTIVTAQHFIGLHEDFGFQRGPLLSIYLIPAEWLSNYLDLHPLDVRIHHLSTAFLHSLYLILSWQLLKKYYPDSSWITAAAYLTAIPSFVFFSYAIFINSDIFPGLILIWMILLVKKLDTAPQITTWASLVVLGFIVSTIKQTYAIFWISIIISGWFFYSRKFNLHLFYAACISGTLSWLAYSWFLQGGSPFTLEWLMGPINQVSFVNNLYAREHGELSDIFPWWLYIRNFYNYGIVASLLILPSLIYCLFYLKTDNNTIKIMASVWLIIIFFMQLTPFKEVRYLEFITPLTAFILVPFISYLFKSKFKFKFKFTLISFLALSFTFDLVRNTNEALRINQRFYQDMTQNYFKPIDDLYAKATFYNAKKSKIIAVNHTGFTPSVFSPLYGDRYHRIFNIPNHALPLLYNFNNIEYHSYTVTDVDFIDKMKVSYKDFNEGDIFLFSNETPMRKPPWDPLNKASLKDNYIQILATSKTETLTRADNHYYIHHSEGDKRPLIIMNDDNHNFRISLSGDKFDTNELTNIIDINTDNQDSITLTSFRVNMLCNNKGCYNMQNNGVTINNF